MPKTASMPFGQAISYKPPHPERTARRSMPGLAGDIVFQEWNNREAMARSIRMQERGPRHWSHWKPVVPLTPTEGH